MLCISKRMCTYSFGRVLNVSISLIGPLSHTTFFLHIQSFLRLDSLAFFQFRAQSAHLSGLLLLLKKNGRSVTMEKFHTVIQLMEYLGHTEKKKIRRGK